MPIDEKLSIEDDELDGAEQGEQQPEDRGDELYKADPKTLAAIAGDDDEDEQAEDEPEARGSKTVPHARFNEVNEQLKAEREARIRLEERLAIASEKKPGATEQADATQNTGAFDFDAKEEAYAEALMEGDSKKAAAIRREINNELRQQARNEASAEIETRQARADFDTTVAEVLGDYPFLDSTNAKAANADAIELVITLRDQLISKGNSPAEALRKAADKIGPLYSPKADDSKAEGEDRGNVVAIRKSTALKTNADTARRQPASLARAGSGDRAQDEIAKDVSQMTESEFSRLPEREKRRLRGD